MFESARPRDQRQVKAERRFSGLTKRRAERDIFASRTVVLFERLPLTKRRIDPIVVGHRLEEDNYGDDHDQRGHNRSDR
jgi:hypothetical protein